MGEIRRGGCNRECPYFTDEIAEVDDGGSTGEH